MRDIELIQGTERALALRHPLRRRILESLQEPDSSTGLSRKLGQPRQRINYHLRGLERCGLLELVEERRRGNCVERVLRATARAYLLSPEAAGSLGTTPQDGQDRFSSSYLLSLAARAIRDIGRLRPRARAAGKKLPTWTLHTEIRFATASTRQAFFEELAATVMQLAARHHDQRAPGGRRFHVFLGSWPAIKDEEETS